MKHESRAPKGRPERANSAENGSCVLKRIYWGCAGLLVAMLAILAHQHSINMIRSVITGLKEKTMAHDHPATASAHSETPPKRAKPDHS